MKSHVRRQNPVDLTELQQVRSNLAAIDYERRVAIAEREHWEYRARFRYVPCVDVPEARERAAYFQRQVEHLCRREALAIAHLSELTGSGPRISYIN